MVEVPLPDDYTGPTEREKKDDEGCCSKCCECWCAAIGTALGLFILLAILVVIFG